MNDNLRNISLQYIKGKNYEKITCFHSTTDIEKIKKILKLDYKDNNYKILEDILKKDKHEIGESLLDDLINYISFKDLKDPIKDAINKKKASLKDKKKDEKKANDKIKKINSFLNEIEISKNAEVTQQTGEGVEQEVDMDALPQPGNVVDVQQYNYLIVVLNNLKNLYITDNKLNNKIKLEIDHNIVGIDHNIDYPVTKIIPLLETLKTIEETIKAANKSSIDNLEKLIKIFKKYLYICENNIKKYEKIFDHNEIGNIDEAFMIESYSSFLKKLYKLKQNLETKDTKKIKRELINSLDQFFNLHGFNNPEKIDNKAEIDYIVQRILNYT